VENPNQAALFKAFSDFIDKYGQEPENRLIFYYAGHGHTLKLAYGGDMGYIVPVDAPNPNKDKKGFLAKAVSMQQIEVYAKNAQAKHALFLFDSCFSGSIFALSRAVPENISYKTAQPVRQFITSGSADEQVPDRSVFKQMFVAALKGDADLDKDGYVTGTELGEFLQSKVINYSRSSQHPQYGKIRDPNLDRGDFVFQVASIPSHVEDSPKGPSKSDYNIDDLEKKAGEKERSKAAWNAKLDEMKIAYQKALDYQKRDIEPDLKISALERFINAFPDENPYSNEDRKMISEARSEVERLKSEKKKIEEQNIAIGRKPVKEKLSGGKSSTDPGIITYNGLQWYIGPDQDTTWDQANSWVKSLTVGGGGWRMPTRAELEALYHNGMESRNMPPEFKTTGWLVWSGELTGSSAAWDFDFHVGRKYYYNRSYSGNARAFAVRSQVNN
jgi:hypothetical protein